MTLTSRGMWDEIHLHERPPLKRSVFSIELRGVCLCILPVVN